VLGRLNSGAYKHLSSPRDSLCYLSEYILVLIKPVRTYDILSIVYRIIGEDDGLSLNSDGLDIARIWWSNESAAPSKRKATVAFLN
jgi:hypothetical protein